MKNATCGYTCELDIPMLGPMGQSLALNHANSLHLVQSLFIFFIIYLTTKDSTFLMCQQKNV